MSLLLLFGGPPGTPPTGYDTADLTTAVSFHLETLLPGDQTVDFRTYANTVRATENEDDLNTAMWTNLTNN